MYARIMVAADDASAANGVLESAIRLAQSFGAALSICHALDQRILSRHEPDVMLPGSFGQVRANLRHGALEFLDKAAETARQAGVTAEVRLVESEASQVADMLAQAAADWRADLLVIGGHVRRGVGRLFSETLAEKLAGKANTSVLIVRRG